jgi:hypothetical protein
VNVSQSRHVDDVDTVCKAQRANASESAHVRYLRAATQVERCDRRQLRDVHKASAVREHHRGRACQGCHVFNQLATSEVNSAGALERIQVLNVSVGKGDSQPSHPSPTRRGGCDSSRRRTRARERDNVLRPRTQASASDNDGEEEVRPRLNRSRRVGCKRKPRKWFVVCGEHAKHIDAAVADLAACQCLCEHGTLFDDDDNNARVSGLCVCVCVGGGGGGAMNKMMQKRVESDGQSIDQLLSTLERQRVVISQGLGLRLSILALQIRLTCGTRDDSVHSPSEVTR